MSPQISVILPVYNSDAYLGAAVASIVSQSFRDFELLAIDGGSTDASRRILGEFAQSDARIRIVPQSGRGLVGALNEGIALARGEFLARMDADDISLPERFARQIEFLRRNPDIAVVGSAMTLIDAEGRSVRDIVYPQQPADVARALEGGSALAHPAVMMRRDAVQRAGGYRAVLEFAEDYDLWLRMSEHASLANLPDKLLQYRHHATKRGCVFAFEQELHTQIARLSAAARRAGRADRLDGITTLGISDIGRFELSAERREQLICDLVEPLLGASKPQELARVEEVFRLIGKPVSRSRVGRRKLDLAMRLLRTRRFSPAAVWAIRAGATAPLETLAVLASLGVRAPRKLAALLWR
ncbi:MAG TPA: glycosyltransferase [Xanthobacteraceae bacterium]|nr:glycosyltransferase [Xanthobacteraceae bacterium]